VRIGLVSFAAPPATGGGAVYVDLLAHIASENVAIDEFHFFCERHPAVEATEDEPLDALPGIAVHRLFAQRATGAATGTSAYIAFARQQLQFINVARRLRQLKLDAVLFHSDVLRRPSAAFLAIRAAKAAGTSVILDSRDIALTSKRNRSLQSFDGFLACGIGPKEHLHQIMSPQRDVTVIPVPFNGAVDPGVGPAGRALLASLGLSDGDPYILMAGGLTPAKGPVQAAETALALADSGRSDLPIVCCGPDRFSHQTVDEALKRQALLYAGRVDRDTHLELVSGAACIASFSIREGVPRTILEAIALKRKVFAPSCVPEFDHMLHLEGDPAARAKQILKLIAGENPAVDYDLSIHNPTSVVNSIVSYINALNRGREN